jgi:hypothetical protein
MTIHKNNMSNNETTLWLESREEDFEQARADGNIELAKEIEKDVRDNGFDTDAWKGFNHEEKENV